MNSEPRIDPANLAFGLWAVTLVLFFVAIFLQAASPA